VRNDGKTDRDAPQRGVVYIATGSAYVDEAIQSAQRLKQHTSLQCTLITNEPIEPSSIDNVIVNQNPSDRPDNSYKLYNLEHTPYSRTLFLDSDTYLRSDISDLFDILDRFDLAVTQAPVRNTDRLPELPDWFPEYNCGVMLYNNNRRIQQFLQQWQENYEGLGFVQDQPGFRKTLFENEDINYFTLMREYNVRFWPGYVDEEVKIVHTHLDNEYIAEQLQLVNGPRAYYFIDNERIRVRGNRENIVTRIKKSLRQRGIVSTVTSGVDVVRRRI